MKWMLTLVASLVVGQGAARAERAATPADATVFIRLVGSVHAELEEAGAAKQIVDLDRIEIGTGSGFVISPHGYVLTNEHVISNSEFNVNDGPRKAQASRSRWRGSRCAFQRAPRLLAVALIAMFRTPRCTPRIQSLDLAVLFISASDLPYVALGDSDVLRNGQGVDALGLSVRSSSWKSVASPPRTSCRRSARRRGSDLGAARGMTPACAVASADQRHRQSRATAAVLLSMSDGYAVGVMRARVKGDAGIALRDSDQSGEGLPRVARPRFVDAGAPPAAGRAAEFSKERPSLCDCQRA